MLCVGQVDLIDVLHYATDAHPMHMYVCMKLNMYVCIYVCTYELRQEHFFLSSGPVKCETRKTGSFCN